MITELEIVNAMLASTGAAPLTTRDTQHPFYIKAMNKIALVNSTVQGRGWWFNSGLRTLNPDVNGEVLLPATALHVDPVDTAATLTIRGDKLYDLSTGSYAIGVAVPVVYIDLVPVAQLPPTAAEYIRARSVFEFYTDEDGNEPKLSLYREARNEAWVQIRQEHLKNADLNFFRSLSYRQFNTPRVRMTRLPVTDA